MSSKIAGLATLQFKWHCKDRNQLYENIQIFFFKFSSSNVRLVHRRFSSAENCSSYHCNLCLGNRHCHSVVRLGKLIDSQPGLEQVQLSLKSRLWDNGVFIRRLLNDAP